eukprot:GCRY01001046.1.p1 GENE.GCRY01001046.1~~GCRY01001046.1.p1  ORF type:complete len:160 (-),score=11.90 GCRY01001046.1:193-672(-)
MLQFKGTDFKREAKNISPPGFLKGTLTDENVPHEVKPEVTQLKMKKAWDLALSPFKQLFMTFLMLYMSGSTVNVFSIMIIAMAVSKPLSGIFNTFSAFRNFQTEDANLLVQPAVYAFGHLIGLLLAGWRLGTMGILPLTPADWANFLTVNQLRYFVDGN